MENAANTDMCVRQWRKPQTTEAQRVFTAPTENSIPIPNF